MLVRGHIICAIALAIGVAACAGSEPDSDLPTKDELQGKADSPFWCWVLGAPGDCDVCDEMGWYGDGSCDQLLVESGVCAQPDPDCAPACFLTHIDDAIALNLERRPRYEALTNGRSRAVSDKLIRNERITRVAAMAFDGRARSWNRQGVPVLCDEFVSLDQAPAFREVSEAGPVPLSRYEKQSGASLTVRLTAVWLSDGYEGLRTALEDELERLAEVPSFHCMLRHVLESTLRAVNLTPIHAARAEALGLASTRSLSRDFIAAQLASLALATGIDEDAAPLQAEGIPILCQDVPPIAPLP